MQSEATLPRMERLLALISPLAVLAGIFLVILQLRQNEDLARLQIINSLRANQSQFESGIMGENFSETLAKIHNNPTTLTDAELYQYDSYAFTIIENARNLQWLNEGGILQSDWQQVINSDACYYFNNAVGRAYLESPAVTRDEVTDAYKAALNRCDDSLNYLQFMRQQLSAKPD